jgi:predicted transcriptional regulator
VSTPTLDDIKARIEAVKRASMLQKPALAEAALESLMQYLAAQDSRMRELEKGQNHGQQ